MKLLIDQREKRMNQSSKPQVQLKISKSSRKIPTLKRRYEKLFTENIEVNSIAICDLHKNSTIAILFIGYGRLVGRSFLCFFFHFIWPQKYLQIKRIWIHSSIEHEMIVIVVAIEFSI